MNNREWLLSQSVYYPQNIEFAKLFEPLLDAAKDADDLALRKLAIKSSYSSQEGMTLKAAKVIYQYLCGQSPRQSQSKRKQSA